MGAPKSAHNRKGKKAWRKNIDTTDVEAIIEETAVEEVRAPKPETLPDDQLFFIDTGGDDEAAPKAGKRGRREPKPLRSQIILEAGRAAKPLWAPPKRRQVGRLQPQRPAGAAAAAAAEGGGSVVAAVAAEAVVAVAGASGKKKKQQRRPRRAGEPLEDIWGDCSSPSTANGSSRGRAAAAAAAEWAANVNATDLLQASKKQQQQQRAASGGKKAPQRPRGPRLPPIAAVEVDAAGCSFNPEPEAHQDALAALVAAEVKKEIAQELAPRPPPETVPSAGLSSRPRDPIAALLGEGVEVAPDADDSDAEGSGGPAAVATDPNAIDLDAGGSEGEERGGDGGGKGSAAGAAAGGKKTRADRNRDARRRAAEAEAERRAALKRQRRELEALGDVEASLEAEEAARAARRRRREATAAERAAAGPPRLGRLKFVPAPAPVLTSDEITGSLRQLAPYPMVAADRYKALQKRGVIEVRRPAGAKRRRKQVEYVQGARAEKAGARQEEVDVLKRARVKAGRKARKAEKRSVAAAAGSGGVGVADADLAAATLGW